MEAILYVALAADFDYCCVLQVKMSRIRGGGYILGASGLDQPEYLKDQLKKLKLPKATRNALKAKYGMKI